MSTAENRKHALLIIAYAIVSAIMGAAIIIWNKLEEAHLQQEAAKRQKSPFRQQQRAQLRKMYEEGTGLFSAADPVTFCSVDSECGNTCAGHFPDGLCLPLGATGSNLCYCP